MRYLLSILLLCAGSVHAQTFDLFKPANGILKGSTSTYVTSSANALDVSGLFSGVCDGTTYLRGDGVCDTPSGTGIGTVTSVAMTWASSGISIGGSPITSSGTLALTGTLNVATGGTGATTLTGLLTGNGTSAIDTAVSADVISLWTGTCDTTTFLRADGSCQTVAGTTDASTLTTGTLADARLSANVPLKNAGNIFSGVNTFTATSDNTGAVLINSTTPIFGWIESDGPTDEKRWRSFAESGNFSRATMNDANNSSTVFELISRTALAVDSIAWTATALTHNGNALLNTTSGLNGTNVTSGTVADSRLSSNVAFLNASSPLFTITGNNALRLANSSTGSARVTVETNGTLRGDICSSTSAGGCSTSDAANDTSLRFAQKLHLSDNTGTNIVASFDTAQVDINATVVNVNSSRINTVANTGKVAFGKVTAATGTLTNSLNVTSVTRVIAGLFTINVTAAGFSSNPACTVSSVAGNRPAGISGSSNTSVDVNVCDDAGATCNLTDVNFSFICHGL